MLKTFFIFAPHKFSEENRTSEDVLSFSLLFQSVRPSALNFIQMRPFVEKVCPPLCKTIHNDVMLDGVFEDKFVKSTLRHCEIKMMTFLFPRPH